jgi:uncharacterized protein with HEPN domain
MSKDKSIIYDIIQAIEDINLAMSQVSYADFAINREKQAAILYFLIIIGEATKRLSSEFRETYTDIDWNGMAGMRDILDHQYDRVNFRVVWDVV